MPDTFTDEQLQWMYRLARKYLKRRESRLRGNPRPEGVPDERYYAWLAHKAAGLKFMRDTVESLRGELLARGRSDLVVEVENPPQVRSPEWTT